MRMIATFTMLLASVLLALPAVAADTPEENAINGRQGEMLLRAYHLGALVAMVKKEVPYDAEHASRLANNLKLLQQMDLASMWMQGSSTDEYPDETRALPKIWAEDSDFAEHGEEIDQHINQLAEVAGNGLDELAPAVKDVAQSCKGCHDDYRAE
ncbi:MAG TPA: cytochrome c [Salinisphaeraceae bacterium]|nr:cytochrome c [Salinisphaeraceae bacterium]